MELLIFVRQYYNGDSAKMGHWLDTEYEEQMAKLDFRTDLTFAQILKAKDTVQNKWRGRSQPGDITKECEDGWWDDKVLKKGKNKRMLECYSCVKIPDAKRARYLVDSAVDENDMFIFGHRNRVVIIPPVGTASIRTVAAAGIYDKVQEQLVLLEALDGRA